MIRLQKSDDRRYVRDGALKMWKTFDSANLTDPFQRGFRALECLDEVSLPPGTGFKILLGVNHDVVTYVREGEMLVRNRPQGVEPLGSGCFQHSSSQPWMITHVPKILPPNRTHLFVSSLLSPPNTQEVTNEVKRFPFSDRHGRLRLVASPEGKDDSLRLGQDVSLYSGILEKGHHVVHELHAARGAWLHVVEGLIRLESGSLETGDGASFEEEPAVSFTAHQASEILLFDMA
jgi:redox-sensitive bicupin YhaK (pirin superfamily)